MVELDPWLKIIILFGLGSIGTFTYFLCVKCGWINFELEPDIPDIKHILAFCFIGGLVPTLMGITAYYGAYIQGFILRATLISLFVSARSKKKYTNSLER